MTQPPRKLSPIEAAALADQLDQVIDVRECPSVFLFMAELREYARREVALITAAQFRSKNRPRRTP